MPRKRQIPRAQDAWVIAQQLRTWSRRQWKVAGWSYLGALLVMGTAGETLPGAQSGRVVPVQWWNYVTLALSPPLIALIAATFVPGGKPKKARRRQAAGAGAAASPEPWPWHARSATRSRSRSSERPAFSHSSRPSVA
jgi:hypothetical protein